MSNCVTQTEKSLDHADIIKTLIRRQSVSAECVGDPLKLEPSQPKQSGNINEIVVRCFKKYKEGLFFFHNITNDQENMLYRAMKQTKVKAGTKVITEGDEGDNFYLIESGCFEISKNTPKGKEILTTLRNEGSFGELALLYNKPRAATVTATTDGVLWAIDRHSFCVVVISSNARRKTIHENFLKTVSILKLLSAEEVQRVADCLITQGDTGDGMYFIENGEVAISTTNGKTKIALNELKKGDYFGEAALLWNKPRMATVTAKTDVTVAKLDSQAFQAYSPY